MSWVSRVTHGIRQPSPVPNGFSGTGTMPGGYPCLTGTYHRYPGVPIPVSFLSDDSQDKFKHKLEWGNATLSSSRHVVYDSGGLLEADRWEPMSLQKESRWEKLAFVTKDEIIIEKLTLFKYVSSHDL